MESSPQKKEYVVLLIHNASSVPYIYFFNLPISFCYILMIGMYDWKLVRWTRDFYELMTCYDANYWVHWGTCVFFMNWWHVLMMVIDEYIHWFLFYYTYTSVQALVISPGTMHGTSTGTCIVPGFFFNILGPKAHT